MDELTQTAKEYIEENRTLTSQIISLYTLAKCEIADGGSEDNEYELFVDSVEELINESNC